MNACMLVIVRDNLTMQLCASQPPTPNKEHKPKHNTYPTYIIYTQEELSKPTKSALKQDLYITWRYTYE